MKSLTFREIADLLNGASLAKFNVEHVQEIPDTLTLYEGSYFLSNGDELPAHVLYVHSSASERSLRAAIRSVAIRSITEVVYPPSAETPAIAIDWKAIGAKKVLNSKDYLIAFMRVELARYRTELQALEHEDLERPSVQTPVGLVKRIPNPLENFLGETGITGDGQLAVLLAEAGHGKTYLSEWVAGRLAGKDERVFPIFVSAKQWSGITTLGTATLEEIICNSFRAFGCPVRWAEGNERNFLRVALRLGVFRLVFDGFDEFALQSGSGTSVREALNALVTLTDDTGARVLVTARTSFWESQVLVEAPELAANLYVYSLEPFDLPKAQNYFKRRLGDVPSKVQAAVNAFQKLQASNSTLAGRGVVLRLVADLAEKAGVLVSDFRREPVSWLMYSLCQRDRERQKLPLTPDKQLAAMREFVLMKIAGVAPTDDTFELAIQVSADIDDGMIKDVMTRFRSHALIRRTDEGIWEFVNQQVELTLLGERVIAAALHDPKKGGVELARLNATARLRPDQEIDLTYVVLSLLKYESEPLAPAERCAKVVNMLMKASPLTQRLLPEDSLFRRLATNIALRSEEVDAKERRERTQSLLRLLGGGDIDGLHVLKVLSRFDLSGVTLRRCLFRDVTFAACKFDDKTAFIACRFDGGDAQNCEGFGTASFIDCTYTPSGHEFVRSQQLRDGSKRYTKDDLHRDLRALVEKFVRKAGVAFKTVEKDDMFKGRICASPHTKVVIAGFERYILDHITISGTSSGGYAIKPSARDAVLFFHQNNTCVGHMADAAKFIAERTGL